MTFKPEEHLIDLKGKSYLQVIWRLKWFRDEKPLWAIDTTLLAHDIDAKHAIFKAIICDENGVQKAAGYGSESAGDFRDYIEKAETKAIGRALAMLGYGTQFTGDELDEGARIVDSPVERKGVKDACCKICGKKLTEKELPHAAKNGGICWPCVKAKKTYQPTIDESLTQGGGTNNDLPF